MGSLKLGMRYAQKQLNLQLAKGAFPASERWPDRASPFTASGTAPAYAAACDVKA